VVDSGIDLTHPDLVTRIDASRTFVGGSVSDVQGHGTFVAGEIAAATNNGEGIAGIGFSADLLVAKVVRSAAAISPQAPPRRLRSRPRRGRFAGRPTRARA